VSSSSVSQSPHSKGEGTMKKLSPSSARSLFEHALSRARRPLRPALSGRERCCRSNEGARSDQSARGQARRLPTPRPAATAVRHESRPAGAQRIAFWHSMAATWGKIQYGGHFNASQQKCSGSIYQAPNDDPDKLKAGCQSKDTPASCNCSTSQRACWWI